MARSNNPLLVLWALIPGALTLALVVVYFVPKRLSGLDHFMPLLHLIPMFYWSLAYPAHMPYALAFAVGLIIDAISGQPLGMSALTYVLFIAMIRAQHKYIHKEGFIIQWGYFALLLGLLALAQWLLASALSARFQPAAMAFMQWFLTACFYPLLHALCDRLYHTSSHYRWLLSHGG